MKNAFSLKKPAFSGIGFITAIFIFGIALFITMEYYHIFTVKESVETDISRALNISVTMAVFWVWAMPNFHTILYCVFAFVHTKAYLAIPFLTQN